MVRTAGIEPALPYEKQILSLLRLPISPRPHTIPVRFSPEDLFLPQLTATGEDFLSVLVFAEAKDGKSHADAAEHDHHPREQQNKECYR